MRYLPRWLLVAATVAGSSCSRESARTSSLVVDTTGSIVRFRHSAPAVLDTLKPTLTIGAGAASYADADSGFARVTSVALNEDGSVLVADGQKLAINLYAPSGQRLASIGRSGQGPGEFRSLNSLAFLGDTLLVLDGPNARVSLFTPMGQFISTWPWAPISGSPTTVRFFQTGLREFLVFGRGRPGVKGQPYIRLVPTGPGDTVSFAHTSAGTFSSLICPRPDQGITFFSTPFAQKSIAVPAPRGLLATASTDRYEIALKNQTGDTVQVISREYEPLPITDEEWTTATAEFEQFKREWPGVKCQPSTMTRPSHHTAIRGIYFDRDGRMIVEVTAHEAVRFDFYATDGTSAGTFILPVRDDDVTPHFRGNRIAQVVKDSLDVQSVQVFTRR